MMKNEKGIYEESPVHGWFGLTYANYFCVPRSALEAMPLGWQKRFVALMEEATALGLETPDNYTVQRRDGRGRFIQDEWADYRRPKINHLLPETLKQNRGGFPDRWEIGMVIQYREDNEWAWSAGTYGVVAEVREEYADTPGGQYQVFYTHHLSEEGKVQKRDGIYWTTPSDVIWVPEQRVELD